MIRNFPWDCLIRLRNYFRSPSPLSFETCCMDQISMRSVTGHVKIRSIYIQLPYILNHHCPSSSMSSSFSTSSSPSLHHLNQSISHIHYSRYIIIPWSQMNTYLLLSVISSIINYPPEIQACRPPGAWMVKKPTFPISCGGPNGWEQLTMFAGRKHYPSRGTGSPLGVKSQLSQ